MDEKTTKKTKENKSGITARGKVFTGIVASRRMPKTAKVVWERRFYISKFERYEKRRSKITAHVPDEIEVKEGDKVTVQECRPISKTKNFIVIKNETKNESH